LVGLFTIKSTTEGLEIKFFIAGILLLEGSLYRGFSVLVEMGSWVGLGVPSLRGVLKIQKRTSQEI
jgi:hypothetical protein